MKHLVALALLSGTAVAQGTSSIPPAWRKVSVEITKQHAVVSRPSVLLTDTDCATVTSIAHGSVDLVSVAVCPVGPDRLAVTWVVRDHDQTESSGALGSNMHGTTFGAGIAHGLPRSYDVKVTVE